jgi:hypothetical protein
MAIAAPHLYYLMAALTIRFTGMLEPPLWGWGVFAVCETQGGALADIELPLWGEEIELRSYSEFLSTNFRQDVQHPKAKRFFNLGE